MRISLNWLADYVSLEATAAEITHAITFLGFEVEGVTSTGAPRLDQVVVGEARRLALGIQEDQGGGVRLDAEHDPPLVFREPAAFLGAQEVPGDALPTARQGAHQQQDPGQGRQADRSEPACHGPQLGAQCIPNPSPPSSRRSLYMILGFQLSAVSYR